MFICIPFNLFCSKHFVCSIKYGVTVYNSTPVILVVVSSYSRRSGVSYPVRYSIEYAILCVKELCYIRSKIANTNLVFCILYNRFLSVSGILINRKQFIKELIYLVVAHLAIGKYIGFLCESIHIVVSKFKGVSCFLKFLGNISHMLCTPRTLCTSKSNIEGIVTYHTNIGHTSTDCPSTIMAVGKADVRVKRIVKDFLLGHFGKKPNSLTAFERTSRLISYLVTYKAVSKVESLTVLYYLVSVGLGLQ